MSTLAIRLFLVWCCWSGPSFLTNIAVASFNEDAGAGQTWSRLLAQAERLQLPTKFLKTLPPDFIHFDFDDLRTYAAEYHPEEQRMVLNRSLSFNAAGRTLKPLDRMTHKELEVLYHELFHAYMDYLEAVEPRSDETGHGSGTLLHFAREQQVCRYAEVQIAPITLRKDETEARYLTQTESWEALNETWAVFVGWAVWNQLEARAKTGTSTVHEREQGDRWIRRFKTAFENGELRGYYVPEDPDERRLVQKRYLAKPSQLTVKEATILMKQVLGFQRGLIERVETSFESSRTSDC